MYLFQKTLGKAATTIAYLGYIVKSQSLKTKQPETNTEEMLLTVVSVIVAP